jgi:hypothetical protein
MVGPGSLLQGEPSKEDYYCADEFIRQANGRGGMPPERRALLLEFRREIARTYQAERQMKDHCPRHGD